MYKFLTYVYNCMTELCVCVYVCPFKKSLSMRLIFFFVKGIGSRRGKRGYVIEKKVITKTKKIKIVCVGEGKFM